MTDVYIGISAPTENIGESVSQVCRYRFEEEITDDVVRSWVHVRLLKSFHWWPTSCKYRSSLWSTYPSPHPTVSTRSRQIAVAHLLREWSHWRQDNWCGCGRPFQISQVSTRDVWTADESIRGRRSAKIIEDLRHVNKGYMTKTANL